MHNSMQYILPQKSNSQEYFFVLKQRNMKVRFCCGIPKRMFGIFSFLLLAHLIFRKSKLGPDESQSHLLFRLLSSNEPNHFHICILDTFSINSRRQPTLDAFDWLFFGKSVCPSNCFCWLLPLVLRYKIYAAHRTHYSLHWDHRCFACRTDISSLLIFNSILIKNLQFQFFDFLFIQPKKNSNAQYFSAHETLNEKINIFLWLFCSIFIFKLRWFYTFFYVIPIFAFMLSFFIFWVGIPNEMDIINYIGTIIMLGKNSFLIF